jgi:hypothetical protein
MNEATMKQVILNNGTYWQIADKAIIEQMKQSGQVLSVGNLDDLQYIVLKNGFYLQTTDKEVIAFMKKLQQDEQVVYIGIDENEIVYAVYKAEQQSYSDEVSKEDFQEYLGQGCGAVVSEATHIIRQENNKFTLLDRLNRQTDVAIDDIVKTLI